LAASFVPPIDFGRTPASLSSSPDTSTRRRLHLRLSRIIECHPSAISPAVEPLSSAEQVTVNPRPYFVPSTASASEILANVAIQDLLAQDAEFYDLPYYTASIPSLPSVSDSWDAFDFVNSFAGDDYSDSEWEEDMEEGTTDDTLQSPPNTASPNQFRGLGIASLPSFVHIINKEIRFTSSSVVEVTFRKTRPESLSGEDNGDGEESIITPVTPFPHPHRLCTIIEEVENEESPTPERDSEDEDEASDTETIRPSSIWARPRLSAVA
jgi:hypothetical protein